MIEFALMIPLLMLLLFGVTEIGRALYQQNTLYKALAVGARYLARTDGLMDTSNCATTAKYDNGSGSGTLYEAKNLIVCGQRTCDGIDPIIPNLTADNIDINAPVLTPYDLTLGLSACVIHIEAHAPFEGIFGTGIPMTNIGAFEIWAETEERYIGY